MASRFRAMEHEMGIASEHSDSEPAETTPMATSPVGNIGLEQRPTWRQCTRASPHCSTFRSPPQAPYRPNSSSTPTFPTTHPVSGIGHDAPPSLCGSRREIILPFDYTDPYDSPVDGSATLEMTIAMRQLREAIIQIAVASRRMSEELTHLRQNHASREELDHARTCHAQATHTLQIVQEKLQSLQVEHDSLRTEYHNYQTRSEIDMSTLQLQLSEKQAKLREVENKIKDSKYLTEAFKLSEEYIDFQNQAMRCGVNWSVRTVKEHQPDVDLRWLKPAFKKYCNPHGFDFGQSSGLGNENQAIGLENVGENSLGDVLSDNELTF